MAIVLNKRVPKGAELTAGEHDSNMVAIEAADAQNIKEGDTRLTNSRTPNSHTHPMAQVEGLVEALAAKVGSDILSDPESGDLVRQAFDAILIAGGDQSDALQDTFANIIEEAVLSVVGILEDAGVVTEGAFTAPPWATTAEAAAAAAADRILTPKNEADIRKLLDVSHTSGAITLPGTRRNFYHLAAGARSLNVNATKANLVPNVTYVFYYDSAGNALTFTNDSGAAKINMPGSWAGLNAIAMARLTNDAGTIDKMVLSYLWAA